MIISSVHSLSRVRLCDPTDCSTPGFPVRHHQLPELAQTHVHQIGDAIQPSHPLSSPSPPAFKGDALLEERGTGRGGGEGRAGSDPPARQPGSDVHGLGRMQRWYIHWGCCYPGTLMEPEESVTVGTVMINSSKSNTTAGETER